MQILCKLWPPLTLKLQRTAVRPLNDHNADIFKVKLPNRQETHEKNTVTVNPENA